MRQTVATNACVSLEFDNILHSLEGYVFTDHISTNPDWEFAGIYVDEGIAGTILEHRRGMEIYLGSFSDRTVPYKQKALTES